MSISNNTPQSQHRIDIKELFHNKAPKIARWIPGFVFRYLKRIIHEDFTNEFLKKHGSKKNMDFVDACIRDFEVNIQVIGEENIPKEGRFVFVSNHPLGGFDGLVLMQIINKHFTDFRFLVNDILMNLTHIQELFIPINKHGKQALEAARQIEKTYKSDMQLLTFPAGLVSRKIKGEIMDLPWQKSFIVKAKKYQRDVIPIHFSGSNSKFFYRLSAIRKFLGIKANLEMLYLADETYHHQKKLLTITIGKPIPYSTFDKSKKPMEWAKWVKEQAYGLAGITKVPL